MPIVLVGTQLDMRKPFDSRHITTEQGQKAAKRLGADYYVECSAKENSGIRETFQKAVMAKIRNEKKKLEMIKRMLNRWTRYSLWYYKSMTPVSDQRRILGSFIRAGTEYTHTRTTQCVTFLHTRMYGNIGYSHTKWTFYGLQTSVTSVSKCRKSVTFKSRTFDSNKYRRLLKQICFIWNEKLYAIHDKWWI